MANLKMYASLATAHILYYNNFCWNDNYSKDLVTFITLYQFTFSVNSIKLN